MKKLLLALAAVAVLSGSADAKLVLDKITIDNFEGVDVNNYVDVEYTSELTGVTYKANLCKSSDSNGGGMQFNADKKSGIVITANPKNYKVSKMLFNRSKENGTNNPIWVYYSTVPYTAPSDLYPNPSMMYCIGVVNRNEDATISLVSPELYVGFKSSGASFYLNYVTFAYEVEDDVELKSEAGLSFSINSCIANMGEAFTAPLLKKATDAEVTYTSSDEEVATVDETTGVVTLVGIGETVITASAPENDRFLAGAASYKLTVNDPSLEVIYESTLMNEDCGFTFDAGYLNVNPWSIDSQYGLKGTAYIDGAPKEASAYAVSPVMDFTNYEAPIILTFEQAINQFKKNGEMIDPSQVKTYINVVGKQETEQYFMDEFPVTFPSTFSWNYEHTTISLDNYAGERMNVAFLYMSNSSIAGTWEIKNMKIEGKKKDSSAVDTIITEEGAAEYYDLQGRRVANPEKGLYICKKGSKATKVIL